MVASRRNGTLYVGVTSDLMARAYQHREGLIEGFTKAYDVERLMCFEMHDTMEAAITREKRMKNWRRAWRIALIDDDNPTWRDLAEEWGFEPLPPHRASSRY